MSKTTQEIEWMDPLGHRHLRIREELDGTVFVFDIDMDEAVLVMATERERKPVLVKKEKP